MADENKKTPLSQKCKQVFIAGILALLPLVVTIYLIIFLYKLLTSDILPLISKVADKSHYTFPPYVLQFSALVIVFVLIFLIGLITRAYVGNRIFKLIEKVMATIPIARTIYYGTKQVIDSFKSTSGSTFSKVALVEFPRKDMWMVAFVVKDSQEFMTENTTQATSYNVFVPTAPNPTSGFICIVDKKDVRELDISVEDGIKFIFSVGLVAITPNNAAEIIKKAVK